MGPFSNETPSDSSAALGRRQHPKAKGGHGLSRSFTQLGNATDLHAFQVSPNFRILSVVIFTYTPVN